MCRLLTLLLFVFLTAACEGEADFTPAPADPVVIPDEPAEVGLELQWTAPSAPEIEEGSEWARPNRIAAGDDYIAVLDRGLPRIHLFSLSGERESSFGEGGEGPGELPEPRWLGVTGDSILVQTAQTSFAWFHRDGEHLGPLAHGDVITMETHLVGGSIARLGFRAVDPAVGFEERFEWIDAGGEIREIELPGPHPLQPVEDGDCWHTGTVGASLARVACHLPLVQLLTPEGDPWYEFRIDRDPVETPQSVIEEAVAAAREQTGRVVGEVTEEVLQQMARQREETIRREERWTPYMHGIAGSPSGHRIALWEQVSTRLGGGNATVHLLDDEGHYLVRHDFETRLLSMVLTDEQLLVMAQDPATGLGRLESYSLP